MKTALEEACEDARHYHYMWKAAEAREARLRDQGAITEAERAFLDAGYAYRAALEEQNASAKEGTDRDFYLAMQRVGASWSTLVTAAQLLELRPSREVAPPQEQQP